MAAAASTIAFEDFLKVDVRVGTVIRSFWSRLPDEKRAPSVKLKVA